MPTAGRRLKPLVLLVSKLKEQEWRVCNITNGYSLIKLGRSNKAGSALRAGHVAGAH